MPWRLFLAGVGHAGRLDARHLLHVVEGTRWGTAEGMGGTGGAQALRRNRLEQLAYGSLLREPTSMTLPNAFGEGGSPADG